MAIQPLTSSRLGFNPEGKGKNVKTFSCVALQVLLSSFFGQEQPKVRASSGRGFGSLTAFPKSRCCPEGEEL